MARSFSRTWRYVGREYLLFFSVSFLFFFFLFFLNQVLVMAEEIFSKKVPFWDVVRLIVFSLPVVTAFAFPFGSLVGALMAVGRLSSENELMAFSSLGVPTRQFVAPLLFLGLFFSLVSFVMNDYFMPLGTLRFAAIYRRILYSNPALELEPYSVKRYENTIIITGAVEGRTISNVLIIDRSPEGNRRIITAREARLDESAGQSGAISLSLDTVFTQLAYPKEGDRYDYTLSDSMIYTILLTNLAGTAVSGLSPSTMSSADVWKQIKLKSVGQEQALREKRERTASLAFALSAGLGAAQSAVARAPAAADARRKAVDVLWKELAKEKGRDVTDQSLQSYLVEFNRKFSMPAACVVFAFFAFPVGMRARRAGRTVGFAVGLFVAIVYWGLLIAGQTFGVRMSLSPGFSMWLPDAMVFLAGTALFARRARR
jgi:lipopolysaccharide export system permease protein